MGLFNLVENFFFISLGITCVLIMLLVFHFKQRLNDLEGKISNIVKNFKMLVDLVKLGVLQNPSTLANNDNSSKFSGENVQHMSPHPFSTPGSKPIIKSNPEMGGGYTGLFSEGGSSIPAQKIVVSDDECDSYYSDDECDSEGTEESMEEDDIDEDNLSDCDDEYASHIIDCTVLDASDIHEEMPDLLLEENVLESNEESNKIPEIPEMEILTLEDLSIPDADNITPVIIEESIAATTIELTSQQPESIPTTSKEEHLEEKDYKKMNVNELRSIIISKGINMDTSKMKKAELVAFLVSLSN